MSTLDNYFELGKSDKTKTANSGTGETGFNYTGSRSNAFLWGMLGRNADDTGELYTRKTNEYYRCTLQWKYVRMKRHFWKYVKK